MKILMVLTSHDQLGNTGRKTGFWLEEFAAPYYVFRDAGVHVTLASPKGGQPPIDPKSDLPENQTPAMARFKQDAEAQKALSQTFKLSDMHSEDFDTIFYAGGHGPMWDLVDNPDSIALIESLQFRQAGRCGLPCAGRVPSGHVQGRSDRKGQACHWLHQRRRGGSSPHQCRALPC
jgi:putative intracellular protease/amidase